MDVRVPALAESVTEGEIGSWLRKDGETVRKNEPILELQTDKASLEIAAEAGGVLRTLKAEGETVKVGDVVGRIEESGASEAAAPEPGTAPVPPAAASSAPTAAASRPPQAAPSLPPPREVAPAAAVHDHYRPTEPVRGVVRETVAAAPPAPVRDARETEGREARVERGGTSGSPPATTKPGTRRERMTRLRRHIAERLVQAQHEAAILTTFNEIDMSAVMALRSKHQEWFTQRYGVKLGFMSLFGRAVMGTLAEIPALNAFIEGDEIVYHEHVHLGIAVQTDKGLVVPVVRDAHAMGLGTLEKEIARLASLARAGRIGLDDLHGGTFTISNGGIFGSLLSTPILNPPQTGILGMHAIQQRPIVLEDGSIVARPMMYVALSYDHRLVDGREAVTFLVKVKEKLEDPERMVLES